MYRLGFLAVAVSLAFAGPAAARCIQPYAPTVKISTSATKSDIAMLRDDVTSFIKASDIYQSCLVERRAPAELISASQAQKERVGREYNALVRSFSSNHP